MLDQGRVVKVERDLAWVEFAASLECARCGACHAVASGKMVTEAENPIGAGVGDLVEVEISSAVTTLFPFIGFGIPILFLFLGLALGSFFSETAGIILGVAFLVVGFLVVRFVDNYIGKQKKFRNRIVRILIKAEKEGVIFMAKDPVCGMEVDEKRAAGSSDYQGKKYYFCSLGCKQRFDKEPEKYAKGKEHSGKNI